MMILIMFQFVFCVIMVGLYFPFVGFGVECLLIILKSKHWI
jgi:uncharacterized membrane protein